MRLPALLMLLLALVMTAMLVAGCLLVQVVDERSQTRLIEEQTTRADLWARMLTARMEAHQRLLTSIAQGMHSSLLDKPAVLDALMQQDGSMLRLFESLHVALPNGSISHHGQVGAPVDIDSFGRDGLRHTLSEGKPAVTYLQQSEDTQHLRVLLSVPMRDMQGNLAGALAAIVKLPLAALLPEQESRPTEAGYLLVASDGMVLVHSDPAQRWGSMQDLMGKYWTQWQELSDPATAHADTRQWETMLITRVGLPLPQWQAVVVQAKSADMTLQQLPAVLWWWLGGSALALSLLGGALVWFWLGLRLAGTPALLPLLQDGVSEESDTQSAGRSTDLPADLLPGPQAQAMALLEATPFSLMLEQDGHIRMATSQLVAVLGYAFAEDEPVPLELLFGDARVLQHIRAELVSQGSYEGVVTLRKRDGDMVQLEALAWTPSSLHGAVVWQLRLPWRMHPRAPLPGDPKAWRDGLTGLPNREAFVWGLQSWINESVAVKGRTGSSSKRLTTMPTQGCVLFADIDHLGMINESISREMRDKVLRHVGRLIAAHTQPLGDVARLGGDEFAVLLPGISLAHAQVVAQALCDATWRWQPSWSGERHWVSISIGVVAADTTRHAANDIQRAADMACYEAKRRGRCQVAAGQVAIRRSGPEAA